MAGVGGIQGLITGIDSLDLINKMLEIERRPIYNIESRIEKNQKIRSAYDAMEAIILALKIDARNLHRRDRLLSLNAVSTDEDVLTATARSGAVRGKYSLTVTQLAQSHQVATAEFADREETTIGTGTITITKGAESPVEITIDSSNNTLQQVAQAINSSGAGVEATVVNVGGDQPAYKIILSGEGTGASQRIVIDEDLAGGTGLMLGEVGSASAWEGSSSASVDAAGNYTGNSDTTLTFTVASGGGGAVGTDTLVLNYSDGGNLSGTLTIPSSYAAGTEISVHGGLKISLGAGTLVEGDSFEVAVESSTIQAPVNAIFSLGSAAGGGTPVELQSSTNTISDLIDNVTIELHTADPTSPVYIDISVDGDSMYEDIEGFINRFNDVIKKFDGHFQYDEEYGEGGELFGDSYAMRLSMAIRREVTDMVHGLNQTLNNLGLLGVTTSPDGTLAVNGSVLRASIEEDPDAVVRLFATTGTTTDPDIQFLLASSKTLPSYRLDESGYDVNITVAASRAKWEGSTLGEPTTGAPLVIDSTNNRFRIELNGRESVELSLAEGAYTSGSALAEAITEAINSDGTLGSNKISVTYVDDGGGTGHLEFTSTLYGSNSTIKFLEVSFNSVYSDIGVTTGVEKRGTNVAGTINGEEATGTGQYLTGAMDNEYTEGLQLLVTITTEQLLSQGGAQGKVSVTKGIGARITEYINDITDANSGALTAKKNTFDDIEAGMKEQIEIIQASIDKKEEQLIKQFINLENAIAEFKAQESYLTSMISQLQILSNYKLKHSD